MESKPKATLTEIKTPTETDKAIEVLSAKYRSTAEDLALKILRANRTLLNAESDKPATVSTVNVAMPKATAEKLYALLGHIRKYDGFNDLFDAFDDADFTLLRPKLHLDFVSPGVLRVEDAPAYRKRTGVSL
jgi:hypothetical protein